MLAVVFDLVRARGLARVLALVCVRAVALVFPLVVVLVFVYTVLVADEMKAQTIYKCGGPWEQTHTPGWSVCPEQVRVRLVDPSNQMSTDD
jgi:hypothetical protein